MSTHAVDRSEIGAYEETLAANAEDTVAFDANLAAVEVFKDDGDAIYFTVDGGPATVKGQGCYCIPGGVAGVRVVGSKGNSADATGTVVRLISAGTPTYSVAKAVI